MRYVNDFSEHPAFPHLPLGMRATSNTGTKLRWVGCWSIDGEDDPWIPNGARLRYRIDFDPSEVDSEPSTLHTIDCHGIDPAVIQEMISTRIAEARATIRLEGAQVTVDKARQRALSAIGAYGKAVDALAKAAL